MGATHWLPVLNESKGKYQHTDIQSTKNTHYTFKIYRSSTSWGMGEGEGEGEVEGGSSSSRSKVFIIIVFHDVNVI